MRNVRAFCYEIMGNGNKISSAAKYGIQTLNKSSIGKAIASNTIKNAKTSGILIGSISNTLKIEKNKISGCSNAGIYIQPATTKYKITATNNTITAPSCIPPFKYSTKQ